MELGADLGHLTYSTLVHPGDTWDEMWASLNRYLPEVKRRVSPASPSASRHGSRETRPTG